MKHALSLSWGYGSGGPGRGGNRRITEWSEVDEVLEGVRYNSGAAILEIVSTQSNGPKNVDVRADRGRYLLTLLEYTEDDSDVRSFTNPDAEPGRVEIFGDYWGSNMITSDFSVVREVFRQFFETGDVSRDLLD